MAYDNQIILSKVKSDNPKAPALRAEITINGVTYEAGLWYWQKQDGEYVRDDDGNRKYKGPVKPREMEGVGKKRPPKQEEPLPEETDDIPF